MTVRTIAAGAAVAPPAHVAAPARSKITEFMIYAVVALFPLQIFAVPVAGTKIDLSNIVFVGLMVWLVIFAPGVRAIWLFRATFSAFLIVELAIFAYSDLPTSRFASAFTWISSLMLLYGYRERIVYDVRVVYWLVMAGIVAAAATSLFEFTILGEERPAGLMSEPSPAGMVILAAVAGISLSLRLLRNRVMVVFQLSLAVLLLLIAVLLKTTHFLTFAVTLGVVAVAYRALDTRTIAIAVPALIVVYLLVSQDAHYLERLDVTAVRTTNVSLLAWLQGFDQMVASLRLFPLTGAGLGGTGFFYFYSVNSETLAHYYLADLNRYDAFSGFFRLIIELGPVFGGLALWAMWRCLSDFARTVRATPAGANPFAAELIFLMTFAAALIFGALLKEPVWSRSTIVVGCMLLFTLPPIARSIPVGRTRQRRVAGIAAASPISPCA